MIFFFLFSRRVGHRTEIHHIGMPTGSAMVLETVSTSPRVFRLLNFFTEQEAAALVDTALTTTEETHRLKR
jgi:hypothetical protein